jgi:hypothetical protein
MRGNLPTLIGGPLWPKFIPVVFATDQKPAKKEKEVFLIPAMGSRLCRFGDFLAVYSFRFLREEWGLGA